MNEKYGTPEKSVKELMNLKGRVACITGGAGHIGSAMADALAEVGCSIVVVDCDAERTSAAATRLHQTFQADTLPIIADLASEDQLRSIPEKIAKRFGRLDILIHSAAFVGTSSLEGWAVPFVDQRADAWRRALEVNLTAVFLLTQACTQALRASGHGTVINVGSIHGMAGPDMRLYEGTSLGNPAAYAASKGGLIQLTRWLATTLAPQVRVNTITPGGVWREHSDPFHSRYASRTPMARMAVEEDFKGAALYLASDLSLYVTGHNLVVDGGWTAW
jgi:NAD(P)-dependent dehydrogenase (short-subunit alcohol dehydrogenase family)